MSLSVSAAGFSGRFSALNGTRTLVPTHADIIRSLLTVGYPSRRKAVHVVGPWRETMLVAMATGYLEPSLNTTSYYRSLEQTEKVGVSFLLGEAFTHWYAQSQMKGIPAAKAVCPDLLIGFKSMAYVMRYNHFTH